MADPNIQLPGPEQGFDRHEPRSGLIALISAATILVLIGMIVGVYWFYVVTYERVEYEVHTGVASKELLALREREDEQLYRYSYIDKDRGIVRIPIDRAMELLVKEIESGRVPYSTAAYPARPEPPGGAAGGALNAAQPRGDAPTTNAPASVQN